MSCSYYVKTLAAILVMVAAATLTGCGGGGGGQSDPLPPTISSAQAQVPIGFSFVGGNVTITADVTDNLLVGEVKVIVQPPSGAQTTLTMALSAGSTYAADYVAPANLRADGAAEVYSVSIRATDAVGNGAVYGPITFSVPAASPPPPKPEAQ